jgi:hypothetical protein
MTSSLLKNQSTRIIGATFILLGVASAPSEATTLTGFSTDGSMMSGIEVTAGFLDGTSQTLIWGATGDKSGGVFGPNWSLTESGNSFDSPWILSNFGQGLTSLVIDTIPGNTVFDIYPYGEGLPHTDGSADGWGYQTLAGQSPNGAAYTDPIDISAGDLFGTLSLYWTSGFTGTMLFRADTDTGSSRDPVQPRDPVVRNSPPNVYFSLSPIYEGQSTSTVLYADDPGEDAISFFFNGNHLGTNYARAGTRTVSADLGLFPDNGEFTYTAHAIDEDGNYSNLATSTQSVLNVAPTLTAFNLSRRFIYEGQGVSAELFATDPGADWEKFFIDGNEVGIDSRTSGERSVTTRLGRFYDEGTFVFTGEAQDKDAAWSNPLTQTLRVLNVAPTITELTEDLVVTTNELFDFAAAVTDPGIYDLLTFRWDFDMDGVFDDFTGSSGQWSFEEAGDYEVGLRVSDGDGGVAYSSFLVQAIADVTVPDEDTDTDTDGTIPDGDTATTVPEPGSVLGILGFSAFGAGALFKRKRPYKNVER